MTSERKNLDHSAMEGGGFYNENSALQASGISLLQPLWETACQSVGCDGEPLVIVDYASSQGRNSMRPIRAAIDALRRRAGANAPIEVIHTDLPSNDLSALFTALQDDADSYMAGQSSVFPAAIGRNYFEPLFAPGTVHLGWNTFSMQWMSRSPAHVTDHVLAGLSKQPNVIAEVKSQQADDWQRFLKVRAHEMRRNAKLLTAFTAQSDGASGWEWLCGELWAAIEDQVRAGLLSPEELRRLSIPIGFRTLDDIRAPFAVNGQFAGLKLEHSELFKIPDPFWSNYQTSGDRNLLAKGHADLTLAWAGPTLMGFIDPCRDRNALINGLFARFAERIAASPTIHEPYVAVAVLSKV